MICKSQCFGDWEPIVHVLHIMQVLESQRERSSSRRSNQQLLNSLEHYCIEDNRGVDRQACWHTEFAWILFVASHKTCDIASHHWSPPIWDYNCFLRWVLILGDAPLCYHLGCNLGRDPDGTLFQSARQCVECVERMNDNHTRLFGSAPQQCKTPLEPNDHPELDLSPVLHSVYVGWTIGNVIETIKVSWN